MDIKNIEEKFNAIAQKYDSQRKCFIPCFEDYYETSLTLLKKYRKDFKNIVDLGAGTGILSQYLYKLYPHANYTLIDASEKMIKIAMERFQDMPNVQFLINDYSTCISIKKADLISSALSIHHLEEDNKITLYGNIYDKLEPGGCFLNLDQFRASSALIDEMYDSWWYDYIEKSQLTEEDKRAGLERRVLDKENTISQTITLLKEAGFESVECIYSFMKFGVILAIK